MTRKQVKKEAVNKIFKSLPLVVVVIFAISMTFVNEFKTHFPKEYWNHKKSYTPIIQERHNKLNRLLKNSKVEKEYYKIINDTKIKLKNYTNQKNKILSETSVIGYESPKNMWLQIGTPISALIFSILSLVFIKEINENKQLKKIALRIVYPFMFTFGYWTIWSLLWFKINGKYDFPNWVLYLSIGLSSLSIILITKYLIKYFQTKEIKLKKVIRSLTKFIIRDAKKHVKRKSNSDYVKDYLKAFKNGMS